MRSAFKGAYRDCLMFSQSFVYLIEVCSYMRSDTSDTGLDPVLHDIVTSAVTSHTVKRTIAEKAVELILAHSLMTREIPAFLIAKEPFGIIHCRLRFSSAAPPLLPADILCSASSLCFLYRLDTWGICRRSPRSMPPDPTR